MSGMSDTDNPTPPGRCACGFGPEGDCPLCDAYPWDPPPEQAQEEAADGER